MSEAGFKGLLERVRAGDQDAAAEIIRMYEPTLRRIIRVRMNDPRVRKLHGDSDIFQSVMGSFFVRAALGQFELREPEDLARLLAVMVRNKVADKARKQDVSRDGEALDRDEMPSLPAEQASPSRVYELRELAAAARARLAPDLLEIIALRDEGLEWAQIAERVGGTAEGQRKRLARAVESIAQELGLDEPA